MKPIAIFQHDPAQRPGFLLEFIDELSRLVLLGSLTPTDVGDRPDRSSTQSTRHLDTPAPNPSRLNLVTIMQDLWYLLLIVIFAALILGLTYGCAALGARK
jgi:hypothetical protein